MSVSPHSEWFPIYGFQIDQYGTATLASLCEYMEEAAGNHASGLGLSMERLYAEGVAWVLSRLQIAPEKMPLLNSRINVETWPVKIEGLQLRRDFIVRNEDGSIAAKAVSHWVVVNMSTRRVERIPSFITEVDLDNAATAMDDCKARLPALEEKDEVCLFRARLADIDRNKHVNNVRYLDWILESTPDAEKKRRPTFVELYFKAESLHNDLISARTAALPEREQAFAHSLIRREDNKELVRARTFWS